LGAVAAVTSTLKLGTGITLVAQRDPIWLAKEVASLDVISGGRVLFGIGYGWNKEELASHGVAYTERRALLRERVLMMKSLWTDEVSEYKGELIALEPSWAFPKPVQKPHPPIIMGGAAAPKTIADMVEFCDGWMPLATRHDIAGRLEEVRSAVTAAGRDAKSFDITAYSAKPEPEFIEKVIELDVNRIVFNLPQRSPEEGKSRLAELSELIRRF
ncbi:MAG TPA: TIGR03619 family F420-dependent LLM class oxidoreductase, partial [Acidimicrobiia bacterium]|nr:TIGR03619 family F420-dependent LLM class oxidoreductase [Acidimicrobiia bacterium]